jgi:hypothetical protein
MRRDRSSSPPMTRSTAKFGDHGGVTRELDFATTRPTA